MSDLAKLECIPKRGGIAPLKGQALNDLLERLGGDWRSIGDLRLEKTFKFKNFRQALEFTNTVGELAEQEDHHPAILTEWGRVTVAWWTHKIRGLHRNDFIMAAKTDSISAALFTPR